MHRVFVPLLASITLFISALVLTGAWVRPVAYWFQFKNAPTAPVTSIESFEVKQNPGTGKVVSNSIEVSFTYKVEGINYTSSRPSLHGAHCGDGKRADRIEKQINQFQEDGTELTCHYLKDNPSNGVLNNELTLSDITFSVVGSILIAGLSAYAARAALYEWQVLKQA